jgi:hypothetical protein
MTASIDTVELVQGEQQHFLSPDSVPRDSVEQALAFDPANDPARFAGFFRFLRRAYPEETTRAILRKLADGSLHPFTAEALEWLAFGGRYLPNLLDEKSLSREEASRVAHLLRESDPKFLSYFSTLSAGPHNPLHSTMLANALALIEAVGAHESMFWWLYGLTGHSDQRIRSRAARIVCQLRPKPELVERQLQSHDARVRANAVEALWTVQTPAAAKILRQAASDTSHRVVMNALVGLYIQGDNTATDRLIEFARHRSPLFQSAAAWALGCIGHPSGIPVLQELTADRCSMVRKRAQASLAKLTQAEPLKSDVTA